MSVVRKREGMAMASGVATIYEPRWRGGQACPEAAPVAGLIYEAFREFYDLFTDDRAALLRAIADQLLEEFSEVDNTKVLGGPEGVLGFYACYPSEEMAERQALSLRLLLGVEGLRTDVFERLRDFRDGVHSVEDTSLYLARIAVVEGSRGAGHGQKLLRHFESVAVESGRKAVSLHVRSDNAQAVRFYRRAGYEMDSAAGNCYRHMSKKVA